MTILYFAGRGTLKRQPEAATGNGNQKRQPEAAKMQRAKKNWARRLLRPMLVFAALMKNS
jgi:hypothetical protein